jgi:7-carboxy-7-deazaguanine synthase
MTTRTTPDLNVYEIFYSLQGESTHAGKPCVFIRLSGCNLRCSYCDTKYAWEQGRAMSISQILAECAKYPARYVEITGGEPMLQNAVLDLMAALHESDYEIALETNGSIYLEDVPEYVVKVVDVKCPGSGCADSFMMWNLKVLGPRDELKFVLTNHEDYRWALDFIKEHGLEERILLFSPVESVLEPSTLARWMLADGAPVRLQLQLHRILGLH